MRNFWSLVADLPRLLWTCDWQSAFTASHSNGLWLLGNNLQISCRESTKYRQLDLPKRKSCGHARRVRIPEMEYISVRTVVKVDRVQNYRSYLIWSSGRYRQRMWLQQFTQSYFDACQWIGTTTRSEVGGWPRRTCESIANGKISWGDLQWPPSNTTELAGELTFGRYSSLEWKRRDLNAISCTRRLFLKTEKWKRFGHSRTQVLRKRSNEWRIWSVFSTSARLSKFCWFISWFAYSRLANFLFGKRHLIAQREAALAEVEKQLKTREADLEAQKMTIDMREDQVDKKESSLNRLFVDANYFRTVGKFKSDSQFYWSGCWRPRNTVDVSETKLEDTGTKLVELKTKLESKETVLTEQEKSIATNWILY